MKLVDGDIGKAVLVRFGFVYTWMMLTDIFPSDTGSNYSRVIDNTGAEHDVPFDWVTEIGKPVDFSQFSN